MGATQKRWLSLVIRKIYAPRFLIELHFRLVVDERRRANGAINAPLFAVATPGAPGGTPSRLAGSMNVPRLGLSSLTLRRILDAAGDTSAT
jgi:hypothetical protein